MGVRKGTGGGGRCWRCSRTSTRCFRKAPTSRSSARARGSTAPGIGDDTRGLALMLAVDPRDGRRQDSRRRAISCSSATSAKKAKAICAASKYPAAEGQVQGSDQAVHRDRRRRAGQHHERRGRQQALPRDVQGAGRSQLRRVRAGQPGVRDGQRDREVLARPGAGEPKDDVQCRRRRRRDVGQLDSRQMSAWTSTCDRSRCAS